MQDGPLPGGAAVPHGAPETPATLAEALLVPLRRLSAIWWMGLACAALAGLCWAAVLTAGVHREQAALEGAVARAQEGATAADRYAGRVIGLSRMLHRLGERWHAQTARGEDDAAAELAWAMRNIVEASRGLILAATILSPDGTIRWSTEHLPPGTTASGRDYITALADRGATLFVGHPIVLRPSGRAAVPISSRLADEAGGFMGAIVVMVPANALARGLANIASRPGEFATIFRPDGTVLGRSGGMADLLGRQILPPPILARLATEPLGEARRVGPVTHRDEIVAWRRMHDLGLVAVMGIDVEAALADVRAFRRTLHLGAGAFTGLLAAGLLVGVEESRRRAARAASRLDATALAKLEAVHAGLPVGVFVLERQADGATRLVHQGGDQALQPDRVLFEAQRPILEEGGFFRDLVREGRASLEWQAQVPAGGWCSHRVFARRMRLEKDGAMLIAGVVLDVTVEREALARIAGTERLSQLGEFALGLAHELKQPLQIITLAADRAQLQAGTLSRAKVAAAFDGIVHQALRASLVIENLRRFARGDAADAPPAPVSLAAVLETTLDMMRGALTDESIETRVAIGDPSPVILARRSALEQVMINLLTNARDALATRAAGQPRHIRISARREAGWVVIEVADTGGGIAPDILRRLFQPFATTKDPDKGTGLGLSICHGLVTGMHGEITGGNGPEGAVMTIRLPAVGGR